MCALCACMRACVRGSPRVFCADGWVGNTHTTRAHVERVPLPCRDESTWRILRVRSEYYGWRRLVTREIYICKVVLVHCYTSALLLCGARHKHTPGTRFASRNGFRFCWRIDRASLMGGTCANVATYTHTHYSRWYYGTTREHTVVNYRRPGAWALKWDITLKNVCLFVGNVKRIIGSSRWNTQIRTALTFPFTSANT